MVESSPSREFSRRGRPEMSLADDDFGDGCLAGGIGGADDDHSAVAVEVEADGALAGGCGEHDAVDAVSGGLQGAVAGDGYVAGFFGDGGSVGGSGDDVVDAGVSAVEGAAVGVEDAAGGGIDEHECHEAVLGFVEGCGVEHVQRAGVLAAGLEGGGHEAAGAIEGGAVGIACDVAYLKGIDEVGAVDAVGAPLAEVGVGAGVDVAGLVGGDFVLGDDGEDVDGGAGEVEGRLDAEVDFHGFALDV